MADAMTQLRDEIATQFVRLERLTGILQKQGCALTAILPVLNAILERCGVDREILTSWREAASSGDLTIAAQTAALVVNAITPIQTAGTA